MKYAELESISDGMLYSLPGWPTQYWTGGANQRASEPLKDFAINMTNTNYYINPVYAAV